MPTFHVYLNDGADWNTEVLATIEINLTDAGARGVAEGIRAAVATDTNNSAWNVYEIATDERRNVVLT